MMWGGGNAVAAALQDRYCVPGVENGTLRSKKIFLVVLAEDVALLVRDPS
jgi:hypothetical protein